MYKIKKLNLIELLVIVMVILLISGLIIPKVTGIVRNAKVANLINE